MNKKRIWIVVGLLVVVALVFGGMMLNMNKPKHSFEAVVLDIYDSGDGAGSLLVYEVESRSLSYVDITAGTALYNAERAGITIADFKPGDIVQIDTNGVVQESYPPAHPQVYTIRVTGFADDELLAKAQGAINAQGL